MLCGPLEGSTQSTRSKGSQPGCSPTLTYACPYFTAAHHHAVKCQHRRSWRLQLLAYAEGYYSWPRGSATAANLDLLCAIAAGQAGANQACKQCSEQSSAALQLYDSSTFLTRTASISVLVRALTTTTLTPCSASPVSSV
jgi:hypothetical protein